MVDPYKTKALAQIVLKRPVQTHTTAGEAQICLKSAHRHEVKKFDVKMGRARVDYVCVPTRRHPARRDARARTVTPPIKGNKNLLEPLLRAGLHKKGVES